MGMRRDHHGVLLLGTILQAPVAAPEETVTVEMLLSEVRIYLYVMVLNITGILPSLVVRGRYVFESEFALCPFNALCVTLMFVTS